MSRIFWDTNLFIYLFEDFGPLSELTTRLRARMVERGDQLYTSALTLGEVLVKPLEQRKADLCTSYEIALTKASVVLPFETQAAKVYAHLRSDGSLRAPDAIQLSCAAVARVDLFVTNDARLQGKQVDGIQFITSLDRVPL